MSFNQGVPSVPTLINSSNVLVFGNTSSGNALSVQQLGAGNVVAFSNASGGSNVFIMTNLGRVGVGTTSPGDLLDVQGGSIRVHNTADGTGSINFKRTSDGWTPAIIQQRYDSLAYGGDLAFKVHPADNILGTAPVTVMTIKAGGNVGIGTASPGNPLHIYTTSSGDGLFIHGTQQAAGIVIRSFDDVSKDCKIRNDNSSLNETAPGNYNFYRGTAFNTFITGFSSVLTGGATTLSVDANGYIIRTPSDARLKSNIIPISYGLIDVEKLEPVFYEWNDPATYGAGRQVGMIAQQVREVIPECVSGDVSLSLDYQKLVPVLTRAIQELSAENKSLKTQMAAFEARLAALEKS